MAAARCQAVLSRCARRGIRAPGAPPPALPASSAGPAAMAPGLQPRPAAPSPHGAAPTPLSGNGGGRDGAPGHGHRGGSLSRVVPEGAAPGEVVPEAGPGCLGGSASGRESSKSQRPAPQRHLYLYCVSTKERDRGGGGASKAAALGGAITSPDIPHQQCRLSHPRGVDLTCHQVLPSPLKPLALSSVLQRGSLAPCKRVQAPSRSSWSQGSSITESGAETQGQRQDHSAGSAG